jgi:glyoxylase-like metal-dependent hydrolase (beta-lactamase superfamily II)
VGTREVVIIDPGPEGATHLDALVEAVQDAGSVRIVLTHGHRDHAPAAYPLAELLGVDVWGPEGLRTVDREIREGDVIETDEGDLVAIETPGHARHHVAFHWPDRRALFAGDLLLGRGATTWVGEYAGCVADYLASLGRLRSLDLAVIYPAHGPPLDDPADAIDRYEDHRLDRIRQVEEALLLRPGAGEAELLDVVYGAAIPQAMQEAALRSVRALMEHVGYPRS